MKFAAIKLSILALLVVTGTARADTPANAAPSPITVEIDQSQLVMLTTDPATVVVGNPSIADISLNGKQMFLHGHSFGETNIMVFDASGNKIVNYYVSVAHRTDNQVTLFAASTRHLDSVDRYTYTCAPNCEGNMMVGDSSAFFGNTMGNSQAKYKFATGSLTADVKNQAPPPQ
jgi:hypothetical protein